MRVVFSKIANKTYQENLDFLRRLWTEKELDIFVSEAEKIVEYLEEGRYLQFQKSSKNTRTALIGKKHVKMYFRKESKNLIKVLLFFEMRQDPQKIPNLLK